MIQMKHKLTMDTRMKCIAIGVVLGGVYYVYNNYIRKDRIIEASSEQTTIQQNG